MRHMVTRLRPQTLIESPHDTSMNKFHMRKTPFDQNKISIYSHRVFEFSLHESKRSKKFRS